ncbi:GTP cyclohydrolase FolE2 [Candidatus Macondimonas diazotrophica]|jgi:GTP cyclohydrolase I|uniref:GTP cyclohydrolase FolE2 n=1 Tax=Candidatus Macondimonas diazotrophica TaxID=2305248 RepID=A0A4Z0F7X5_9GAMM|nr:GTP cyclohydrolase FolE2 [Candidatus Macondimonas diazotrophica]MDY6955534.1 GTP cyclohydrolase FolE2 [Pseudomonadota bacterium]NCU01643.1 GTP cyclohydrolase I FolE2 [Candidatus Macondimonas diazotrophica]TFZ82437.1 GTP cyclohydrolase I FolE2 [Candidatus Macondimonas diazotrophica]HBG52293.1 GTP cyclohydrolase I FolE2 [Gammaproteobacteria bacterium]
MKVPGQVASIITDIADVQGSADHRRIAIDRVGIRSIRHPLRVADRSGGVQHTVARLNMYVSLPHHQKGTHMSRFVAILGEHDDVLTVHSLNMLMQRMTSRLEADSGHLEIAFPYFVDKSAPVSGVRSLMDYEVTLTGVSTPAGGAQTLVRVVVPVTSLCPCSKEISDYGAHNQRSHVTVEVRCQGDVWIEDLVDLVETEASAQLYGLLKRPDEKFVTERAYDNPKFVEDMVRDVAVRLDADERVLAYTVESENFESIHNHSAYAVVERVKDIQDPA